jgi:hypothetical protein
VVEGETLTLYEVREGPRDPVEPVVGPWARLSGDIGTTTWFRPGATGWLRGFEAATVSPEGNVELPDATGPVWYWPSLLVIGADFMTIAAILVAQRHRWTR